MFHIVFLHIPIVLTVAVPLLAGWPLTTQFAPIHIIFLELVMGPNGSVVFENEPAEAWQMPPPSRPLTATFLDEAELSRRIAQRLGIGATVD